MSCDCRYEHLGLRNPEKYGPETSYLPPTVYSGGLSEDDEREWEKILEAKGRVPFISYPIICARCGRLWPKFFMVPDAEWSRYIQMDQRRSVLCLKCYNTVKTLIDGAKG